MPDVNDDAPLSDRVILMRSMFPKIKKYLNGVGNTTVVFVEHSFCSMELEYARRAPSSTGFDFEDEQDCGDLSLFHGTSLLFGVRSYKHCYICPGL